MDQTIPQGGWWSRNWKWFVPVGCLSLLATCGCCIGGSVLFTFNAVKNSHAYQEAVTRAKADPDVQKALGAPVEAGMMVQINAQSAGGVTTTTARIPLSGPKGEGALFVRATDRAGTLTFQQLDFVMGHDVVHLPGVEPSKDGPSGPGGGDDIDLDEPDDGEPDDADEDGRPDVTVEANTMRIGGDFRDYEMADGDAAQCAMDCAGEPKCKGYTFVKPANGKPGRCQLKDKLAEPKVTNRCCVSGVKK
ncbi:MAG TPA: cytochrome c oxidase assembly factor Coa1 family protein [Myxococcaceae bacterium]|jgi:hypothetical protein